MDQYGSPHCTRLLTQDVNRVIKQLVNAVDILSPHKDPTFRRNVKYSTEDYCIGIIDVLKGSSSWNSYSGKIDGNTLRKKHKEWIFRGCVRIL